MEARSPTLYCDKKLIIYVCVFWCAISLVRFIFEKCYWFKGKNATEEESGKKNGNFPIENVMKIFSNRKSVNYNKRNQTVSWDSTILHKWKTNNTEKRATTNRKIEEREKTRKMRHWQRPEFICAQFNWIHILPTDNEENKWWKKSSHTASRCGYWLHQRRWI